MKIIVKMLLSFVVFIVLLLAFDGKPANGVELDKNKENIVLNPRQSISITNKSDNLIPINFYATENILNELTIDFIEYDANFNIYDMDHNKTKETPIYILPKGVTKITNTSTVALSFSVPNSNISYEKVEKPTLKVINLKPSEKYIIRNTTQKFTVAKTTNSCYKQYYLNYKENDTGFGTKNDLILNSIDPNMRIDFKNDSDNNISIYMDNSFEGLYSLQINK